MEWFRSYHGAPFDPKWRFIAQRAEVRCGEVAAIWWTLLDHASQQTERGDVTRYNVSVVSCVLEFPIGTVQKVINAFEEIGLIENGRIANWEKYQGNQGSSSTERVRKWRETQRNALHETLKRDVTIEKSREEQNREEEPPIAPRKREASLPVGFEQFWSIWPNKVGKPKATTALGAALKRAPLETILHGVRQYIATKPPDRPWLNPATFLNQDRWTDQPATVEARNHGLREVSKSGGYIPITLPEQRAPKGPPPKVSGERLRELGLAEIIQR